MRYALLIFVNPDSYDGLTEDERNALTAEYMTIADDPRVAGGAHLRPIETATTLRGNGDGFLTTDGPFADTKEVFGGWFLLDAADIDEAMEVAARIPAMRGGGAVEVRPVVMESGR